MNLLGAILGGLLEGGIGLVPIFVKNPVSQEVTAVLITTVEDVLSELAKAKATPTTPAA